MFIQFWKVLLNNLDSPRYKPEPPLTFGQNLEETHSNNVDEKIKNDTINKNTQMKKMKSALSHSGRYLLMQNW